MKTLKETFKNNPEKIQVTDQYPWGRDKNASTSTSSDGTPLNNDTLGDIRQALFAIIHNHKKGITTPNGQPETVDNSQIVQALDAKYANVGEIITMQGQPDPNARLLQLNGQTIDLSLTKYADLKKYVEHNETIYNGTNGKDKFTIFTDDATETDNWKFKRDKTNPDLLTLPKPNQGDALIANTDNNKVGNTSIGAIGDHTHNINSNNIQTPASLVVNVDVSHTHNDNIRFIGSIDTIMMAGYNHPASGAFYAATGVYATAAAGKLHNHSIPSQSFQAPYFNRQQSTVYISTANIGVAEYNSKIMLDSRRAGGKLGTIAPATLNIDQNITIPAQQLDFAPSQTDMDGNSDQNHVYGLNTVYYIRY